MIYSLQKFAFVLAFSSRLSCQYPQSREACKYFKLYPQQLSLFFRFLEWRTHVFRLLKQLNGLRVSGRKIFPYLAVSTLCGQTTLSSKHVHLLRYSFLALQEYSIFSREHLISASHQTSTVFCFTDWMSASRVESSPSLLKSFFFQRNDYSAAREWASLVIVL